MDKYKTFKLLIFWLILVVTDTVAQLLLKLGAVKSASSGWAPNYLIVSGYSLYIVSFIAWMQILKNTRLFIALSATSVLYITIPFASHFLMGEALTASILIGALFIAAGVLVLGLKENK
jgi:drug/metabolite transporter (DMT)-like permease